MGFDPKIAFGLRLTKVSMAAKGGQLGLRDRLNLLSDALAFFRDDDEVCAAVLAFNDLCQRDQVAAGEALSSFLQRYIGPERFGRAVDTEAALYAAESAGPDMYSWQKRADING